MSDAALTWSPEKWNNFNFVFKAIDIFSSNHQGLYTLGRDSDGNEIFYQKTTYHRYGPIFEINLNYTLNRTKERRPTIDSEFGKKEF